MNFYKNNFINLTQLSFFIIFYILNFIFIGHFKLLLLVNLIFYLLFIIFITIFFLNF